MLVTLDQMKSVADEVVQNVRPLSASAHVLALTGNLGAGKTTFTQHLAASLGVTESITSPTFVVMKRYDLLDQAFTHLVHIDAYRLEHSNELEVLGFQELLQDPQNLIVIEWPENVAAILPENKTTITLEVADTESRNITITYAKED